MLKKISCNVSNLDRLNYWKDSLTCIHASINKLDYSTVFPNVVEMYIHFSCWNMFQNMQISSPLKILEIKSMTNVPFVIEVTNFSKVSKSM